MMKLKPDPVFYGHIGILLICLIGCAAVFAISWGTDGLLAVMPVGILLLWTGLRYTLAVGKTIVMQEDGCTIIVGRWLDHRIRRDAHEAGTNMEKHKVLVH